MTTIQIFPFHFQVLAVIGNDGQTLAIGNFSNQPPLIVGFRCEHYFATTLNLLRNHEEYGGLIWVATRYAHKAEQFVDWRIGGWSRDMQAARLGQSRGNRLSGPMHVLTIRSGAKFLINLLFHRVMDS